MRLIDVYNKYLRENDPRKSAVYYDFFGMPCEFKDLSFFDIERYFHNAKKESCIPQRAKLFFAKENRGKYRVAHMFSVYLLGIYCYDNIVAVKDSFNVFIKEKIWSRTHESEIDGNEIIRLRKDFLYLWFLTALFHDIGYLYETPEENDNTLWKLGDIIDRKKILSPENLGNPGAILGIPQKIRYSAKEYFWQRKNCPLFHEHLCVDHGFAGGMIFYNELKKLHYQNTTTDNDLKAPTNGYSLVFSPLIFNWYNVPSAWAIICHNIFCAFAGTGKEKKYEMLGLDGLVFPKGKSLINHYKHPLLFLLDFVDTLDPLKKCVNKYNIINYEMLSAFDINCSDNSLKISLKCPFQTQRQNHLLNGQYDQKMCLNCNNTKILKRMSSSVDFLFSCSFEASYDEKTECAVFTFS